MKERFATPATAALLALLLLAAAMPATAQLVKIRNDGAALAFYPTVETKGLTLTVDGPCGFRYQARGREELVFRVPRDFQEGAYSFSVDAIPVIDGKVMEILRAARESGKTGRVRELCRQGRLPTGPTSQTGGFTIVEGKIVLDTTPERMRSKVDGRKAAAIEPSTAPAELPGTELAARPAPDADPPVLLAQARSEAPAADPGECVWASMQPGAGVAER